MEEMIFHVSEVVAPALLCVLGVGPAMLKLPFDTKSGQLWVNDYREPRS